MNCNDLEQIALKTEEFRDDLLFGMNFDGSDALAEQHYMAALAALDSAMANFRLAHIHQMRATR